MTEYVSTPSTLASLTLVEEVGRQAVIGGVGIEARLHDHWRLAEEDGAQLSSVAMLGIERFNGEMIMG